MSVHIIQGDALALPLPANSVDLVVTSPPYYALRSYTDAGVHYAGQVGDEPTPHAFLDALLAATAEMVRVLKPSGSIFVNLGDKYAGTSNGSYAHRGASRDRNHAIARTTLGHGVAAKSLMGLPWRYAIRCVDELGLTLRQEIVWDKPNAMPESVTDRCRRSHEQWFHFTLSPRYFAAVDEIRGPHSGGSHTGRTDKDVSPRNARIAGHGDHGLRRSNTDPSLFDPRGKLPGSVWSVPSEPLNVPGELGVDHFAAFPTEWPRRLIHGWCPLQVCTVCGQGRRPTTEVEQVPYRGAGSSGRPKTHDLGGTRPQNGWNGAGYPHTKAAVTITGHECACPTPDAASTPGVVLDPFGGTGTTALVADVLGRYGISVDMSRDYCRLARWRTTDPRQRAKAARHQFTPPRPQATGQLGLFEEMTA
ncbi:MAG: DNA-methyltransferase [Dermatophilaceae bacterium]